MWFGSILFKYMLSTFWFISLMMIPTRSILLEQMADFISYQFSSDQLLSCVRLFVTWWTAARQASLIITNSRNLFKLISIESVMPSNYLILCLPLLLPQSIFPSIRVFSNESVLCIRWPKYQLTFYLGTLLRTLAQEVSLSESSEELFQSKKGGARVHRRFCWGEKNKT